jgi:protein TonB
MPVERFDDDVPRLRVSPQAVWIAVSACVLFLLVVSVLAGVLVYPSLHPKTVNDFPELKAAAAADAAQSPAAVGYVAGGPQLILSAQADPPEGGSRPQTPRAAAAQPRGAAAQAQVAVWPYVPQAAGREAPAAAGVPGSSAAARGTPAAAAPVPVASTTLMAYALAAPQPAYPADEPKGISGTVVVQVTVSKEGKVTGIRAVSGPEELRPATVQAVEAWRFRPYLIDGAPADVVTTLGFLFREQ